MSIKIVRNYLARTNRPVSLSRTACRGLSAGGFTRGLPGVIENAGRSTSRRSALSGIAFHRSIAACLRCAFASSLSLYGRACGFFLRPNLQSVLACGDVLPPVLRQRCDDVRELLFDLPIGNQDHRVSVWMAGLVRMAARLDWTVLYRVFQPCVHLRLVSKSMALNLA